LLTPIAKLAPLTLMENSGKKPPKENS